MNVKRILATKGTEVITISPAQSIKEAVLLLAQNNIGALVVVDDKRHPIGILSERDVIRRAAKEDAFFNLTVESLMTPDPITGLPQDDLKSVAATMTVKRFRHLPIVDGGQLVGIVSIGDILKAERDEYRGTVHTLEIQMLEGKS